MFGVQVRAVADAIRIHVEAREGTITLRGTVRSNVEREAAERAAWATPGVISVVDELSLDERGMAGTVWNPTADARQSGERVELTAVLNGEDPGRHVLLVARDHDQGMTRDSAGFVDLFRRQLLDQWVLP